MPISKPLVPAERIERCILVIREQRVIVDADLAKLYGVPTKRLNEQVRRNRDRFPEDFVFQLNREEKSEVVANCDHLQKLKYSSSLPYAFTEHGAIMAANVLNSQRAIQLSVYVVRAFVRLRQLLASHDELRQKLLDLERRYDKQFRIVFEAIHQLLEPPTKPTTKIGFIR